MAVVLHQYLDDIKRDYIFPTNVMFVRLPVLNSFKFQVLRQRINDVIN